ncbi:hypothetical protein NIIDMKKI_76200 [Mycobacterium kansasii]|nr:hypothetical protein NIIDMKKI_76200 [Mycobacterium kansasii]
MVVVALYAFAVSYVLALLIERSMGFRLSREDEVSGVDLTQHAETAYPEGVYGHQAPGARRWAAGLARGRTRTTTPEPRLRYRGRRAFR